MTTQGIRKKALQRSRNIPVQTLIILIILIFLIAVFSFLSPKFFTSQNLLNIVRQVSYVIITGCAITFLMISGYIDLSVGSVAALSGVAMALLAQAGVPMIYAIAAAISLGFIFGFINGLLTVQYQIPPFIATLGTMMIGRGLALIFSNGMTVREELPQNFVNLGRGEFLEIPLPFWIMIIAVVVSVILKRMTLLGRYSIAIGGNRIAAELSGINVKKLVLILYIITGTVVGFTGAIQSSRLGVGEPNIGAGFEFDVIIAVILGGTTLAGGEGSIIGMVIGALIVGVISNGLNLMGVLTFYQSIIKGAILVAAVLLGQLIKNRKT
jgi:ribose/xylose/arabinose/galactoside ABC-type transport system permease subunit